MKVNKRKATGLVGLGLALTVIACGPDGVEMMGDAMVDAGEMLMDAGGAVSDAGDAMTSDAAAQMPTVATADCVRDGDLWWAEANVDVDTSTVTSATVIMCGLEGTQDSRGNLDCFSDWVAFSSTRARTNCGTGDPAAGGFRYSEVRFVFD